MSVVLRKTYLKATNNILFFSGANFQLSSSFLKPLTRTLSDGKSSNPQFTSSTILIENGLNFQELPVIVRKLKALSEINDDTVADTTRSTQDSLNYHLIQEEFKQCLHLREVFSLLTKCTKITPSIALGAIERIYDLEKQSPLGIDSKGEHINMAKGAILDKLLKVVMKTEDTQTILNILNTASSFMEPYKYKFSEELLFRAIDNKLTIENICDFVKFLITNRNDLKYSETIDRLWVAFVEKESEISEINIAKIYAVLHGLKSSKRTILALLEHKFSELWPKISVPVMQEILHVFIQERYLSIQSFAIVSRWLYTNIHALDEDSLLDIITKLTTLKYSDNDTEKAVEKYMKLKRSKIESHVLIVGILNYCIQFQIRNEQILNACAEYFVKKGTIVPTSFLKSFIYPFGHLYFRPNNFEFWILAEKYLEEKFDKLSTDDLCSIILSFIYVEHYPLKLVSKMFSSEYLIKVKQPVTQKKLHLIDTALSLECEDHCGPLLPKDQCPEPISQDSRIRNIVNKTMDSFVSVAGGVDKLSTAVLIPHLFSHETYLLDIMLHPTGLGSNTFNWKSKSAKNENVAILIHLPDHYCSDNEQLIGPQMMKKKHLKILGLKVVSLKYSLLSQFYTSYNTNGLKQYINDCINNAEPCI